MKKVALIACACALFFGAQSVVAQEAQVTEYASDPAQGYLFNRFQDNWFVTAEGGASLTFSHYASELNFGKRLAPAASIYVGKWFSPIIALRAGVNYFGQHGVSEAGYPGTTTEVVSNALYRQNVNQFGLSFDAMLNLTNWWCGYKPARIYNAVAYVGLGGYLTYGHTYTNGSDNGWKNLHNNIIGARVGIINSFNVSKQVALSLDVRYVMLEGHANAANYGDGANLSGLQAFIGVTYNFKKRDWSAPVVPICPEPENCDALRARLAAADARIADLEKQLKDCLNRPVETVVESTGGPLASVYFPIGVSRLSNENKRVVKAIANVMTQNSDKKYVVTGWADNYTGSDAVNKRLRKNRAENVAKVLYANGVAESQIEVTTNDGNYADLGEKCVALERAVTIEEAK